MTVAQGANKLKRYPLPFYVFQKGPGTQTIVERVVEVLSDKVAIGFGLDDALVSESIGNVGQGLSLIFKNPRQSRISGEAGRTDVEAYVRMIFCLYSSSGIGAYGLTNTLARTIPS